MKIPEINNEQFKKFVGDNTEFYLLKWNKMQETKNIISWNWAAFFFHVFWFACRKMYYYVYFFVGLISFRYLVISKFELPSWANYIFKYAVWFVIGAIANYLYLLHADKKIKIISTKFNDNDIINKKLKKTGGVNYTIAVIIFFIFIILITLPLFISFFRI